MNTHFLKKKHVYFKASSTIQTEKALPGSVLSYLAYQQENLHSSQQMNQ